MARSTLLRKSLVAMTLSAVAFVGMAQSAQAVAWGTQTLYWASKARGKHWGDAHTVPGQLANRINVSDTLADGNPIYSNMKNRHWYLSSATATWVWSGWSRIERSEVHNGTIQNYWSFPKNPNGNKWQVENVIYINLNNMPDSHATPLYTEVPY